jgi:hypothetical protein
MTKAHELRTAFRFAFYKRRFAYGFVCGWVFSLLLGQFLSYIFSPSYDAKKIAEAISQNTVILKNISVKVRKP